MTILNEHLRILVPAVVVAGLCCNAGCTAQDDIVRIDGATMGTFYSVQLVPGDSGVSREQLASKIEALLERINDRMSTYRDESELMRFNTSAGTGWVDVSEELAAVLTEARRVSEISGGAFDVTVGPLVNLWGFGPDAASPAIPSEREIERELERVGYRLLAIRQMPPAARKARADVFVDLSALAKGFAVERLAELLQRAGLTSFLVEIGGELKASGVKPGGGSWLVAIEQPATDARRVQRTMPLADRAVATSGDYRNFFELGGQRYSHTIDPRTGWPVSHAVASVTVVSSSAMTADAFATALLVLGEEDGFKVATDNHVAALFLLRNGEHVSELATPEFASLLASGG